MPNFEYRARDKFAKLVTGTTIAEEEKEAVKKLQEMGYVVIHINKASSFSAKNILQFRRVKLEEINSFTRQLHSMLKAGLPLLSCLEAIAQQTKNHYFKGIIEGIIRDIRGGLGFSFALKKHRPIFNAIYINMVKAAETSGLMVDILGRLTSLIEQEMDTSSRIKAATRYPIIAFFVLLVGFLIVVGFVIPRFAAIYSQFNTLLPLPTQILISISIALRKFWYLFSASLAIAIFAFLRFINSKAGRPLWDNLKLKVPVLGPLVNILVMSRFARVTAILMKSGVPILEVLDLVAGASGNIIIARAISNIKASVNQGKGMSEPMRVSNLFPQAVIQMVSAGEQTGRIDELLSSIADYYDTEAGYMIKNLTTYIEPVLIFVLGVMVLIMALAIFLPMWNLIRLFRPV